METTNRTFFGVLRIAFGIVWAIDAAFKWKPAIRDNIIGVLTQAQDGQPAWEQAWINVWVHIANLQPEAFGILIALVETLLAIALITGIGSRIAMWLAIPFTLIIWSVPQGFGGPYASDTTDIDSGLIYCLMFVSLLAGGAWRYYSLQNLLTAKRSQ